MINHSESHLHRRLPHVCQIALQLEVIHYVYIGRGLHPIDTSGHNGLAVSSASRGGSCVDIEVMLGIGMLNY
jgi:hypothetical protein